MQGRLALAAALAVLAPLTLSQVLPATSGGQEDPRVGYSDTPFLPDGSWRVHDRDRPRPPTVTPGRDGGPPSDAIALFDGTDLEAWRCEGGEARWLLVDGAMQINGTGSLETAESFGDCQLHVEWAAPREVVSSSQGRGNSGLYFMGRYEIQILDSWGNPTYADGQAAAMYGQRPPEVNACLPPGEWQSYDIVFRAPRFEGQELVRPARVTVLHNGVLVHEAREYHGPTTHRKVVPYSPHGEAPLLVQDHGNPVRFRNIWIRRL